MQVLSERTRELLSLDLRGILRIEHSASRAFVCPEYRNIAVNLGSLSLACSKQYREFLEA